MLRDKGNYSPDDRHKTFESLVSDEELSLFVKNLFEMIEKSESPMAKFWMSIMNMIEILMMNIHSL